MKNTAQTSFTEEIFVDNFAGGGGASTGIETGLGVTIAAAINHDPAAILMHKTNHPYTEHYQASVWDIDPRQVCRGRPVAGAWFSPDCKHFSKAKGAALVDKKIRGLAWITLRWAALVRPRVIFLENVEEFQTWGPVRKGKPIKKLAGTTFQKFLSQLRDLGYAVEYRKLVAADYGAPTTRKRFVLIARCDGQPIVWPTRTHAPRSSEEVHSGKLLPWRSAAEIIDWSLPCPSVFDSKAAIREKYGLNAVRPLADNTMRRIIRGVDKFTIKSGSPFLVECNHSGAGHVADIKEPHKTITAKHTGGLCEPLLAPITVSNTGSSTGADASRPVHTVRTGGGGQMLVTPSLMCIGQTGGGNRIRSLSEPAPTTVSKQEACIVAPSLIQYHTEQTEYVCKVSGGESLGHWPEIRTLLNRYCEYELKEDDLLLLKIKGSLFYIADIGLRMLSPRELYNAMGFPSDYIIDRDYMGNPYPKNEQVARCGNAVCPPMAAAVARANFPEYVAALGEPIRTMGALLERLAV